MATTTCHFSDPQTVDGSILIVQVVGIDADGEGIHHYTLESALEYAHQANKNGFTCFVYQL